MAEALSIADSRTLERIARTNEYLAEQDVPRAIGTAKLAHAILDEIMAHIKPGMRAGDVKDFAFEHYKQHGITETWHPPYVRFGEDTLLTFMNKVDDEKILGETDICFVDIGIVKDGIEGDAGRTISFGNNAEHARVAKVSETIFNDAREFWKAKNTTGIVLYEHIYALAEKLNVAWNLDPAGHLIGAYPHKGWRRGINHFPETVEGGKWILEIQVKHKELPFGSFYEDVLYA